MGNKGIKNKNSKPYAFRMFVYENIEPDVLINKKIPSPRSGHRIVCDAKNLYSFGGYNPCVLNNIQEDEVTIRSYPLFRELWKFNFALKKWVRFNNRESLPKELASNAVIRQGNCLMVYGGTGAPFGYRCSNKLYLCRLSDANNIMNEVNTEGNAPLAQYGQALVYHNDYLYTVGGTTGYSYTCDIHRLNLKNLTWETVYASLGQRNYEPEGRYRHELAFDGQNIYVLGGGTAEDAFGFDELPTFNLEKKRWSQQKTYKDPRSNVMGIPSPRRCHGAVQMETVTGILAFISGGYDGTQIYDDLWSLNLKTFQWSLINTCQLPQPTYFHSTAITPEGKMYIFGGINFIHGEIGRNNVIHATWLCIPKLSEMCWEAILFYNPQIVNCTRSDLADAGLPRHFIQRLE